MKPILILRHVPHESAGTLEDALTAAGLKFRYVDLFQKIPSAAELDLTAAAGLVVMGGPMNVDETDKYPFLAAEIDWIRQALAARLPTLGICLGAQLLAKACGAKVFSNRVKEIGWYVIDVTPQAKDDPLFGPAAGRSRSSSGMATHSISPPAPSTWPKAPCASIRRSGSATTLTDCNSTSK